MPSRRSFLATLGAATLAGTAGCLGVDRPSRDGSWPVAGRTDARRHNTPLQGPVGDLYPAWTAATGEGVPPTTPVVADGTVFVLQSNSSVADPRRASVVAYDAATGEERWTTTLLTESTDLLDVHFDSLRFHDGRLYAQTVAGVYALTPEDGTEQWFAPLRTVDQPWPRSGAPVVAADTLVATTYGDRESGPELQGFHPKTGDVRWRTALPAYADPWTLTALRDTVYVPFLGDGDTSTGLVAIDAASGDVVWESSLPVDGPVTAAGDRLVVPLRDDEGESIAVVDRTDRSVLWRRPTTRRTDAGVAVAESLLYYVSDGRLLARRFDTGEQVWSFGDERRGVRAGWTPVVADSVVYVAADELDVDGTPTTLYALGDDDGATLGAGRLTRGSARSSLAVVEGAAYLTLGRGEIRCYEACSQSVFGRCVVG